MNSTHQTEHNDNAKVFNSASLLSNSSVQDTSEMICWQRVKISPALTQRLWPPVSNSHQWQTDGSETRVCHQCLWALGRRLMGQTQISSLPLLIINQNQPGPEHTDRTLTLPRVHESQIISHPAGHMVPFKPLPGATKEGWSQSRGAVFLCPVNIFLKTILSVWEESIARWKNESKEKKKEKRECYGVFYQDLILKNQ